MVALATLVAASIAFTAPLEVCIRAVDPAWCSSGSVHLEAEVRSWRASGPATVQWQVDGHVVQTLRRSLRPASRYEHLLDIDLQHPPGTVKVTVRTPTLEVSAEWSPPPSPPCPFDLAAEEVRIQGGVGIEGTVTNHGPYASVPARVRWVVDGSVVSDSVLDALPPGGTATLALPLDEVPRSRRAFLAYAARSGLPLPPSGDPYLGVMVRLEVRLARGDLDPSDDAFEILVPRRWLL